MQAAHLELSLRPADDGDHLAEIRFQAADSRAEAHLIDGPPPRLRIDLEQLLAYNADPDAYGRCLSGMLFADPRLVAALQTARTHADAAGVPLRLSLRLDPGQALLHSLRWETLHDPVAGGLLASERVLFSRYLDSPSIQPLTPRARGALSALIVVAAPRDLADYRLAPIDVTAEVARAEEALGPITRRVLASGHQPVTMARLREALTGLPDILYLVCHGTSPMGQPTLWLERDDRTSARVEGEVFVRQIAGLGRRPLLIVLATCQSAGLSHSEGALAAIAPQLAREGVAAVVAMQGNVSQQTVATAMPIFFRELLRDGQIDRALAAARGAVLDHDDWWSLTLLLRVRDGRLWLEDTAYAGDSPTQSLARRARQRVLQHVRDHWIKGVLEGSLHAAAMIDLGLEARPEYVAYPWEVVVERAGHAARSIPPGTSLTEVFDETGGELLILGAPGSGKTTMLLDLARSLLGRAERDERTRLPVIFHLSLWAERRQSLRDWLEGELEVRYGVPKEVAADWIASNQILPLLDGLDEVKLEHRNACVGVINAFWKDYGAGLVVCSRIADYESLSERLRLRGAVLIQPLSNLQIDDFLQRAGPQLAGLRTALRSDPTLRELADSPLMLSMMSLAYQGKPPEEIRQETTGESRQNQLFATYVQRMLTRPRAGPKISPEQMISQLAWLARGMVQNNLSVFYLDELQPTWVSSRRGSIAYALGSSLLVLMIAVIGGALLGVGLGATLAAIAGLGSWSFTTWGGLTVATSTIGALAGGVIAGLHLGVTAPDLGLHSVFGRIYTVRRVLWDWKRFWVPLRATREMRTGLVAGVPIGVLGAVLLGDLLRNWSIVPADSVDILQIIAASIGSSLALGLGIVLVGLAVQQIHNWVRAQVAEGRSVARLISRLFIPITNESLLGLVISSSAVFIMTLAMDGSLRFDVVLLGGFAPGFVAAIILGLYMRFIDCSRYESRYRRAAQEYQYRAALRLIDVWSKATILSIAGGIAGGVLGLLLSQAICVSNVAADDAVTITIFTTAISSDAGCGRGISWVFTGALAGMVAPVIFSLLSYGGKSFLQRLWLRLILALSGGLAFRPLTLLDAATDRVLLRKVGDGYLFVHRLVLEYVAALSPVQTDALLGSLSWAIIERGLALRDLGQLDEAVKALTQALELEPGNYKATVERALIYRRIGRHEDELRDFDRAIKLEPAHYWTRVQRAIALRQLQRYDEALA